jgi:subtilisin family serine protease
MPKKIIIAFILITACAQLSLAADSLNIKYWISFKDKGSFKPGVEVPQNEASYNIIRDYITKRALDRRMKVLPQNKLIGFEDMPVNEKYVEKITSLGINIIGKSRWFNGVSAYMSKSQMETVKKFNFVDHIFTVRKMYKQDALSLAPIEKGDYYETTVFITQDTSNAFDYGKSYPQMVQIDVPKVHNLGIWGQGVLIASFDDGFEWKQHESLKDLNVIAEFDFINGDNNTSRDENQKYKDAETQGGHGTATLSSMAGFMDGKLVSPAFGSDIILAKTEYVSSETPMEEDFWLMAAEWAEGKGADVITSSLVYKEYDKPYTNNTYFYAEFDGQTAITTIAGDRAAYLGIVVCNAVGNYFQTAPPSLGSASDGDSVIGVGAVDKNGTIATFSSNGPTSDGRIKPDVVAQGVNVYVAKMGDGNRYEFSNGTSFSTPITAGVCALILSAHPELTAMQVREALRNTANNSSAPNNVYGWGVINAFKAMLYFGPVWSPVPSILREGNSFEILTAFAANDVMDNKSVLAHYRTAGETEFKTAVLDFIKPLETGSFCGLYQLKIDGIEAVELLGKEVQIWFNYTDSKGAEFKYPRGAPKNYFSK